MTATEAVVLFQVGSRILAARAAGVERIGSPREDGAPSLLAESCLGRPRAPLRSLIVHAEEGLEAGLCVDRVLGIRSVGEADLLPLPALAAGTLSTAAVAGLVMLDGAPTPLVDLPTLIREQRQAAARDARSKDA